MLAARSVRERTYPPTQSAAPAATARTLPKDWVAPYIDDNGRVVGSKGKPASDVLAQAYLLQDLRPLCADIPETDMTRSEERRVGKECRIGWTTSESKN